MPGKGGASEMHASAVPFPLTALNSVLQTSASWNETSVITETLTSSQARRAAFKKAFNMRNAAALSKKVTRCPLAGLPFCW